MSTSLGAVVTGAAGGIGLAAAAVLPVPTRWVWMPRACAWAAVIGTKLAFSARAEPAKISEPSSTGARRRRGACGDMAARTKGETTIMEDRGLKKAEAAAEAEAQAASIPQQAATAKDLAQGAQLMSQTDTTRPSALDFLLNQVGR